MRRCERRWKRQEEETNLNSIMIMGPVEHELQRFMEVCLTILASLTYCYFISTKVSKGFIRLIFLLPVISIFTLLPLSLSSMILRSTTGFLVGWVANFHLLLLAFDKGPLSSSSLSRSSSNNMSLLHFISLACLPIKIKQNPSPITKNSSQNESEKHTLSSVKSSKPLKLSRLYYAIQFTVLALVHGAYKHKDQLHPTVIVLLYGVLVFTSVELFLSLIAVVGKFLLGLELEPQFNNPLLATSLQDFWGKRWNLVVSNLLRTTIYEPVRSICKLYLGRWWARTLSILASFIVSGLMHDLLFFYMGRSWPTWDVTWSFVLQAVCLILEIELKEVCKGKFQLHRVVSGPLTLGFVVSTGFWLFFPVFGRVGLIRKANIEFLIFGEFAKNVAWKAGCLLLNGMNRLIY